MCAPLLDAYVYDNFLFCSSPNGKWFLERGSKYNNKKTLIKVLEHTLKQRNAPNVLKN